MKDNIQEQKEKMTYEEELTMLASYCDWYTRANIEVHLRNI